MSLDLCAFQSGDASATGVTFLTFLEQRPVENTRLETRMTPNQLVGWYNGSEDLVELWIVSPEGWYLRRAASGYNGIA